MFFLTNFQCSPVFPTIKILLVPGIVSIVQPCVPWLQLYFLHCYNFGLWLTNFYSFIKKLLIPYLFKIHFHLMFNTFEIYLKSDPNQIRLLGRHHFIRERDDVTLYVIQHSVSQSGQLSKHE